MADRPQRLSEADLKARPRCWRPFELKPGDEITGGVLRMPVRGAFNGSKIFLDTGAEIVALAATEKVGHKVLERELGRKQVRVGQRVTIRHGGFRKTNDGQRRYRLEQVVA
jgi:hypothetical protein